MSEASVSPSLLRLWGAETKKLFSRTSTRAGIVLAIAMGLCVPLVIRALSQMAGQVNGQDIASLWDPHTVDGIRWTLTIRNFFIFRGFILLLAALSFASELQASTLREDLLRPVSRTSVLLAKWGAIGVFIVLSLLLCLVLSGGLSFLLLGGGGDWKAVLSAYFITAITDMSFAAVAILIGIWSRSVSGTIMGMFLFMILDTGVGWFLEFLSWMAPQMEMPAIISMALSAKPWLPSAAFELWRTLPEAETWPLESMTTLACLTLVSLALANRVFSKLDIP